MNFPFGKFLYYFHLFSLKREFNTVKIKNTRWKAWKSGLASITIKFTIPKSMFNFQIRFMRIQLPVLEVPVRVLKSDIVTYRTGKTSRTGKNFPFGVGAQTDNLLIINLSLKKSSFVFDLITWWRSWNPKGILAFFYYFGNIKIPMLRKIERIKD